MRRLDVIDGLRGYFLVFMMINHLVFAGGYWIVYVNHRQLGFVEDAQGFVFLSGLLVGMVYARKMARSGYDQGARALWRRAGELWIYATVVLLIILALYGPLRGSDEAWRPWLHGLRIDDPLFVATALTLLYQPTYMDILPQYIVYLLVAPPLVRACMEGRYLAVVLGSVLVWFAVQIAFYVPLLQLANLGLGALQEGLVVRAHFNIFAWQIVFMGGLVLGVLSATGRIDWGEVFHPDRTLVLKAALVLCLLMLPFRVSLAHGFMPEGVFDRFRPLEHRGNFGPVYLASFLGWAYVMGWILIAGPRARAAWVRGIAAALTWVFRLGFLRLLGRHSLQVYAWHVLVVYLLRLVDIRAGPFDQLTKSLIAIGAIVLLAVPALLRERPWLDRLRGQGPGKDEPRPKAPHAAAR